MGVKRGSMEGIELYESIDELPIGRYQLYQLFLLQDSGIGSTMADVVEHLAKMDHYMSMDLKEQAMIERRNLQLNYFAITEDLNYEHLAFACLVKEIDGEPQLAKTQHDIVKINQKLKDRVSHKDAVKQSKKKKDTYDQELKLYFSSRRTEVNNHEIILHEEQKQLLIRQFESLAGQISKKEYTDHQKKFYKKHPPKLIDNSKDSQLIQNEMSFTKTMIMVSKEYPNINVNSSVKEFYTCLELTEEQNRKLKEMSNGRR